MACTVKKCWPDKVAHCECNGALKGLSEISESPESFLRSKAAWAQTRADNPEFMWQVFLSQVTNSTFSPSEIASFTICSNHEVNLLLLVNKGYNLNQIIWLEIRMEPEQLLKIMVLFIRI